MSQTPNTSEPVPPTERLRVVKPAQNAPAKAAVAPLPAKPAPAAAPAAKPAAPNKPASDQAKINRAIQRAKRKARRTMIASFALVVGLPTLVVAIYYAFFAADQYASIARFAVRGSEQVSADLMSMMAGASTSAANTSDSYIVQEFIRSPELVERLEKSVGVRARFDRDNADWWARFPVGEPLEEFMPYWRSMVVAEFDTFSGMIKLEVKAFTSEDAYTLAAAIVSESQQLVNRLSEQSRLDSVAFAQREVQFAEERLRESRTAVTDFQNSSSTVDPSSTAAAFQQMISELESSISSARTELAQIQELAGANAPSARILKTRIAALEAQLDRERERVGKGEQAVGGLSNQLSTFEALKTEAEFAEKHYLSAMASLENARAEAKRDQRYLASVVQPTQPSSAVYPHGLLNTILVLIAASLAWAIGSLLVAAIKDHTV